jgi:two-component system, cell cycle sensor histidine kinase and response regulator CckA
MEKTLRILNIEDSEDDSLLILDHLKANGYDVIWKRVDSAEAMKTALKENIWDIVLSDYQMPRFDGLKALSILKETGMDIPFIIISGTIGEDTAVEAMRSGANDYIMKDNLKRFIPTIERELHEAVERAARKHLEEQNRNYLHFLESMDRVNSVVQGTNNLEMVMRNILKTITSIFNCDRASLLYPSDGAEAFWQVQMEYASSEYPSTFSEDIKIPITGNMFEMFQEVMESNSPVTFHDGPDRSLTFNISERFAPKSIMALALYPKTGKPWLLVMHQCSYARVWIQNERQLFQEIGRRLSDTLTRILMYRDLCKSEAENKAIVNAIPDLLFRVQKDGTITDFRKPENMEMYLPPDRFLGRVINDVLPSHVSDAATKAINNAFKTNGITAFEYDLEMKGGRSYFEGRIVPITGDEVLAVIRDITEQKRVERSLSESESKMRSILDNIGIGVSLISPKMEILELNHTMRQWFPNIDINKTPVCYEAFNDPPRGDVCDYCPTCKTFKDGLMHEAITETPHEGGIRRYRIVSFPIFNSSGEITSAVELVEDNTERHLIELQFHQAQKMESVGRLAGGVAHDFNNMLGVIIGYSDLAMTQIDQNLPVFSNLKEIRKAAQRSADLSRQLLAFARQQTVAPKVLDLNETVEGMLKMLQRLIGEDITLAWRPGQDLWPIKIDPSQVDQVLANLCVNARDAIAGIGMITIETQSLHIDKDYYKGHPEYVSGDYVLLSISDNGCGMDKTTLDKIFEPFFTTKESGKGTGLGLSTVYGIVRQNRGFINVYSEPGHGTTFKICFPSYKTIVEKTPEQKDNSGILLGQGTILLVEDEPSVREMGQMMLEKLGYRVLATGEPDEAFKHVRNNASEIQLLITDVVMPKMNGKDLAKEMDSICPGIKTLFTSGYTRTVIAKHGILDSGVNFIQKPFSISDLSVKVREILNSGG